MGTKDAESKVDDVTSQLEESRAAVVKLQSELETASELEHSTAADLKNAEVDQFELASESELNELKEELAKKGKLLEQTKVALANSQSKAATAKQELSRSEQEVVRLTGYVDSAKAEVVSCNAKVKNHDLEDKLLRENQLLKEKNKELMSEVEDMRVRLNDASSKQREADSEEDVPWYKRKFSLPYFGKVSILALGGAAVGSIGLGWLFGFFSGSEAAPQAPVSPLLAGADKTLLATSLAVPTVLAGSAFLMTRSNVSDSRSSSEENKRSKVNKLRRRWGSKRRAKKRKDKKQGRFLNRFPEFLDSNVLRIGAGAVALLVLLCLAFSCRKKKKRTKRKRVVVRKKPVPPRPGKKLPKRRAGPKPLPSPLEFARRFQKLGQRRKAQAMK